MGGNSEVECSLRMWEVRSSILRISSVSGSGWTNDKFFKVEHVFVKKKRTCTSFPCIFFVNSELRSTTWVKYGSLVLSRNRQESKSVPNSSNTLAKSVPACSKRTWAGTALIGQLLFDLHTARIKEIQLSGRWLDFKSWCPLLDYQLLFQEKWSPRWL